MVSPPKRIAAFRPCIRLVGVRLDPAPGHRTTAAQLPRNGIRRHPSEDVLFGDGANLAATSLGDTWKLADAPSA